MRDTWRDFKSGYELPVALVFRNIILEMIHLGNSVFLFLGNRRNHELVICVSVKMLVVIRSLNI